MASILVETAVAIAAALSSHQFSYGPFEAYHDFEGREPLDKFIQELAEERLIVRVIVPERFARVERFTRGGGAVAPSLRYCAAYDIDVICRLGSTSQESDVPAISVEALSGLTTLVEDIHHFFVTNELLGTDSNLSWVQDDDALNVNSEPKVPYSAYFLEQHRVFYGLCREYFWKER